MRLQDYWRGRVTRIILTLSYSEMLSMLTHMPMSAGLMPNISSKKMITHIASLPKSNQKMMAKEYMRWDENIIASFKEAKTAWRLVPYITWWRWNRATIPTLLKSIISVLLSLCILYSESTRRGASIYRRRYGQCDCIHGYQHLPIPRRQILFEKYKCMLYHRLYGKNYKDKRHRKHRPVNVRFVLSSREEISKRGSLIQRWWNNRYNDRWHRVLRQNKQCRNSPCGI